MIDRQVQRDILLQLSNVYPLAIPYEDDNPTERFRLAANLIYLAELGLITGEPEIGHGKQIFFRPTTITAKGLDFIADDGGISAVLDTITIKIHGDTIRDLINGHIDALHITEHERAGFKHALKSLSKKGLEAATSELLRLGISHVSEIPQWIQKFAFH